MPYRRLQSRAAQRALEAPYRSSPCRVGQHRECAHSVPTTAPRDVPVIYEACTCACHTVSDRDTTAGVSP